jgi:RES domain-containing protein
MVYLGGSLALAALELLVHLDHRRALARHQAIPVEFDEALLAALDERDLPDWFPDPGTLESTQRIGDAWLDSGLSALLRVPSAVVPQEFNYLLNPAHADAPLVRIGEPVAFAFDRRLLASAGGPRSTPRPT